MREYWRVPRYPENTMAEVAADEQYGPYVEIVDFRRYKYWVGRTWRRRVWVIEWCGGPPPTIDDFKQACRYMGDSQNRCSAAASWLLYLKNPTGTRAE